MLRQARSEGIVIHLSTLWDTYFPGGKDHRMEKCSAVSIPYLEGDYFPGEWEIWLIKQYTHKRACTYSRSVPHTHTHTHDLARCPMSPCVGDLHVYLSVCVCTGEAENQLDTITNGPKGGAKGNAKGSAARAAKVRHTHTHTRNTSCGHGSTPASLISKLLPEPTFIRRGRA